MIDNSSIFKHLTSTRRSSKSAILLSQTFTVNDRFNYSHLININRSNHTAYKYILYLRIRKALVLSVLIGLVISEIHLHCNLKPGEYPESTSWMYSTTQATGNAARLFNLHGSIASHHLHGSNNFLLYNMQFHLLKTLNDNMLLEA